MRGHFAQDYTPVVPKTSSKRVMRGAGVLYHIHCLHSMVVVIAVYRTPVAAQRAGDGSPCCVQIVCGDPYNVIKISHSSRGDQTAFWKEIPKVVAKYV